MKKHFSLLALSVLLLAGCTTPVNPTGEGEKVYDYVAAAPESMPMRSKGAYKKAKLNAAYRNAVDSAYDFSEKSGRKMTYTTTLTIDLPDTVKGVKQASAIAVKYKGYVVSSDNNSVNLKLPVADAAQALTELEQLGTVVLRKIQAEDITARYTDTEVRLDNLRRLQTRLGELLKRANRVDEMLKIERELSRVTTQLENYQAQMNRLNNQVQMVDVFINFNTVTTVSEAPRSIIPVKWVRKLGNDIFREKFSVNGSEFDDFPATVTLPAGFAMVCGTEQLFQAADPNNTGMQLKRYENIPGADLAYYRTLVERQLKYVGFADIKFKEDTTCGGVKFITFSGRKNKYTCTVMIAIAVDGLIFKDEYVYVFEVLGEKDEMAKLKTDELFKSVKF